LETCLDQTVEIQKYLPGLSVKGIECAHWMKLFAPGNTTFDASVKKEAEDLFRTIGYAILEDRSRRWFSNADVPDAEKEALREQQRKRFAVGYGDDQRLVVFRYNVPKTTVTLLWEKRGQYNGVPWRPLFPINEPE
jgi:hypothetical protein